MKIAVLFGGESAERDVSIATGAQVYAALKERGHEVLAIDTAKGLLSPTEEKQFLEATIGKRPPEIDTLTYLPEELSRSLTNTPQLKDSDLLFLALHGGTGEDGTMQAFLDMAGIQYTGSGHRGSAYAMDKDVSKHLLQAAQIPTPDWIMAPVGIAKIEKHIGYPFVVKPNKQGSSVGLTIVNKKEDYEKALEKAESYDKEIMIEQFIPGRELTVGILEDRALAVGEIIPQCSDLFDYESKYQKGGAKEIFPAELTETQTQRVQELGLRAHHALKLQDYSRVDFRFDEQGIPWCLEVNTLPGLTAGSLLPQSAQAVGISFAELCERICTLACRRKR